MARYAVCIPVKIAEGGICGEHYRESRRAARGASRYLPEHARNEAGKKMLGTTSILLRGIPFIYQGQEIGMTNCIRNDISEYDDISTKDQYQVAIDAGCSREGGTALLLREQQGQCQNADAVDG